MRLRRKVTEEDLRHKGFPFECNNCGSKPTPEEVVKWHGECAVCGDEVIAFTVDTAELLLKGLSITQEKGERLGGGEG